MTRRTSVKPTAEQDTPVKPDPFVADGAPVIDPVAMVMVGLGGTLIEIDGEDASGLALLQRHLRQDPADDVGKRKTRLTSAADTKLTTERIAAFKAAGDRCLHPQCIAVASVPEFDGFCVTHATPEARTLADANREQKTWYGIDVDGVSAATRDEMAADPYLRADVGDALRRKRARVIVDELEQGSLSDNTIETEILDRGQLANLPDPNWLIDGVLPGDSYGVLVGRDDTYKTFTGLSIAASIATGSAWFGRKVARGRVLYLAGEGARAFDARLSAWEAAWGVDIPVDQLMVLPRVPNMFKAVELTALCAYITAAGVVLVIVDTLRRAAGGADGNGSDMAIVVDNLDRIRRATQGGTVLAQAHSGKSDEDTRGFSGIEDDADFVWRTRIVDGGRKRLKLDKMKDAPSGTEIFVRPTPVLGSIVLEIVDNRPNELQAVTSETRVLSVLCNTFPENTATPAQLIRAFGEMAEGGLESTAVYKALRGLETKGLIVNRGTQRSRLYQAVTP
jgi:hypothetical protein